MSNETSARVEGESGMGLSAKQKVLAVYPNAECTWTSRGWRVIGLLDGAPVCLGKTKSGHVPEAEAWEDAASKLAVLPEPKVGESGLSDEQPDTDTAMTAKELADSFNSLFQPAPPEAEYTSDYQFLAKPEPLPNTLLKQEQIGLDRVTDVRNDLAALDVPDPACSNMRDCVVMVFDILTQVLMEHFPLLAESSLVGAPNTLQEKRAQRIIREYALLQVVREYRTNRIEGGHALCVVRTAGLMHGTRIDDRCSICIKADELLAAPKVVDSKEEQEICVKVCEWCGLHLKARPKDLVASPNRECPDPLAKVEEQDGEQKLRPRPTMRSGDMASHYAISETDAYMNALEAEIKLLKAESVAPPSLPTQDYAQNLRHATQIAEYLHEHCFPEVIQWKPISGDLSGVLMQIDNMCTGVQRRAAAPVALPTHRVVETITGVAGYACLRCSCGRTFVGLGDKALASSRASFEAHLPEKEGKSR